MYILKIKNPFIISLQYIRDKKKEVICESSTVINVTPWFPKILKLNQSICQPLSSELPHTR